MSTTRAQEKLEEIEEIQGRKSPLTILEEITESKVTIHEFGGADLLELQLFAAELAQAEHFRRQISLENIDDLKVFSNAFDPEEEVLTKSAKVFTIAHFLNFLCNSLANKKLTHFAVQSILAATHNIESASYEMGNFYSNFQKLSLLSLECDEIDFSNFPKIESPASEKPRTAFSLFFRRQPTLRNELTDSDSLSESGTSSSSSNTSETSLDNDQSLLLAIIRKRVLSIAYSNAIRLTSEMSKIKYSLLDANFIGNLGQQLYLARDYKLLHRYFDVLKSMTAFHWRTTINALENESESRVTLAHEIAESLQLELAAGLNQDQEKIQNLISLLTKFLNIIESLQGLVDQYKREEDPTRPNSLAHLSRKILSLIFRAPTDRYSLFAFILTSRNPSLIINLLHTRVLTQDILNRHVLPLIIELKDESLIIHAMLSNILSTQQIQTIIAPFILDLENLKLIHQLILLKDVLNAPLKERLIKIAIKLENSELIEHLLLHNFLSSQQIVKLLPVIKKLNIEMLTLSLLHALARKEDLPLIKHVYKSYISTMTDLEQLMPVIKKLNNPDLIIEIFNLEMLDQTHFIELLPLARETETLSRAIQLNLHLMTQACIGQIIRSHGIDYIIAMLDCDVIGEEKLKTEFIPFKSEEKHLKPLICDYILSLAKSEEQKRLMECAFRNIGFGKFFWMKSQTLSSIFVGPALEYGELGRLHTAYVARYEEPKRNSKELRATSEQP